MNLIPGPGSDLTKATAKAGRRQRRRPAPPPPYVELHGASAFSFLRGASLPEDLMERAAAVELPAMALVDVNGVYGAPRFDQAARRTGVRALVGAEVVLSPEAFFAWGEGTRGLREVLRRAGKRGPLGLVPEPPAWSTAAVPLVNAADPSLPAREQGRGRGGRKGQPRTRSAADHRSSQGALAAPGAPGLGALGEDDPGSDDLAPRVTLLVESRTGYRNLCRLLSAAAAGRMKGEARASWELIAEHSAGLHCLTGGMEGPLARALRAGGMDAARKLMGRMAAIFPGRLHVELQRHRLREEEHRNRALVDLARGMRLPLVASNGVRYARAEDKALEDVLTAIRCHTTLDAAGRLLECHRERHLKGAAEMRLLFADLPEAIAATGELAERLDFTLADLGYRFPAYPLPPGETPPSYLRHVTWNGARARFRPLSAKAQAQIQKELDLIEKLDLAGYFLIVWDIVRFCLENGILAQGRGSAANSAVCYALSITAVDPVKMDLLFERFLSEERGEWPDIDLDLPSGDQRERVIQHVYQRHGPHGAAMTANVITYRDRSATREVAKVFGYSAEQIDKLASQLGSFTYDLARGDPKSFVAELGAAGFDPDEPRIQRFAEIWHRIHDLPRHLGQHSGGMVLAAGRLDEIVPLEPAAMPGRVVVQWDKDDCADLGIIKVDLLGLGMLSAIEDMVPTIHAREGVRVDLAHLPPDDPVVYKMLREADTVGVFQVESRAQMSSLPRNNPHHFYDLVIQVAIIRPGPIAGNMTNPYFERRAGRQPVTYPHPSLEPILARTLGVPIFQEQLLRIAMVAAGFTGGEAEELRRAMGFKRSVERMRAIEARLRSGMEARGITGEAQEGIVQGITSFALYGFPESHAASFALIAYASAYLKAHHPTAFYLGILNAWPMGFYHPATLVRDAQRHGVEIRPIDVQRSGWRCRWEDRPAGRDLATPRPPGAIRLGLRFVHGLRSRSGLIVEEEQAREPFADLADFTSRCALPAGEVETLASIGALACFGLSRRGALWQAARLVRPAGPLLAELPETEPSPLPEMTPAEETQADFGGTQMTLGPHPLSYRREQLRRRGIVTAADLARYRHGDLVRTAGAVIVRQRPGTAKGLLFLTLEDETGMSQAIVSPDLLQQHRRLIVGSPGLVVEGVLQKRDGSISVRGERFWAIEEMLAVPSHDFR
ncbi:MAG TPA: error-prone DNA polymerase [Thermoanaerobaculia bacterium]|nr:error-prone DNA polymerase [Thermoanaerobaculia bacterium]